MPITTQCDYRNVAFAIQSRATISVTILRNDSRQILSLSRERNWGIMGAPLDRKFQTMSFGIDVVQGVLTLTNFFCHVYDSSPRHLEFDKSTDGVSRKKNTLNSKNIKMSTSPRESVTVTVVLQIIAFQKTNICFSLCIRNYVK